LVSISKFLFKILYINIGFKGLAENGIGFGFDFFGAFVYDLVVGGEDVVISGIEAEALEDEGIEAGFKRAFDETDLPEVLEVTPAFELFFDDVHG
jgi:hypothetical protein